MKITPANILNHELIGLKAKVFKSKNASQVGICGIIIDETMKTILLETVKGRKRIFKRDSTFLLELPNGAKVLVEGKELLSRPEDRLKRKLYDW
ncbi:MAG: ribonuclease P protein subunit [Thermofilaceae archaeon]|nr:ribonuclease P protein subunit [Thermofilaceae archaeon]MCX8180668.1 ribonuclease P protein subunit [Thermofilaceae archaeon]MDW8003772.1 ribonuclease P protein subunit [Thermofilaceae archaeon]